jgi:AcrR family transcriptional regulator
VYYFKDKRALYEAVLEDVFGGLHDALSEVLVRGETLPDGSSCARSRTRAASTARASSSRRTASASWSSTRSSTGRTAGRRSWRPSTRCTWRAPSPAPRSSSSLRCRRWFRTSNSTR